MYRKYGNKKTECKVGHLHDSKKESAYCDELRLRQRAGDILSFSVGPKIELQEGFRGWNGKKVIAITYTPDFVVYGDGYTEYVDVKGNKATQTEAWKLKWKMLQHKHAGDKNYRFTIA